MVRKALMVARWEYIEKLKSKAFLISIILTPILMLGFGVVPSLLMLKEDTESRTIGVIDQSQKLSESLKIRVEERYRLKNGKPNYLILPVEYNGDLQDSKRKADQLILSEQIEGCLVLPSDIEHDSVFEYRSQNVGNIKLTERLSRTMRDVIIEKKLLRANLNPSLIEELRTPIDLKGIKLSKGGKEEKAGFQEVLFTAYGFLMMMFIMVMMSGQMLVRSMLEEKSNRVVEVLLSSCSSNDLMAGKILGLSALGLTQIAFWTIIGLGFTLKFGDLPITGIQTLLIMGYFILGYVFYSAIFVAVGAPISTEQEAQQMTSYISLIFIIPLVLAMAVLQNPNSLMAKALSFFPLTTPTMMALRIPVQMPATWEIIGTILVLILSTGGMMWVAGKIFRTTILLTGKRPGIAELLRIIRTR